MYSDDACAPGVANRGMKGYEWDASLLWDVRDGRGTLCLGDFRRTGNE